MWTPASDPVTPFRAPGFKSAKRAPAAERAAAAAAEAQAAVVAAEPVVSRLPKFSPASKASRVKG